MNIAITDIEARLGSSWSAVTFLFICSFLRNFQLLSCLPPFNVHWCYMISCIWWCLSIARCSPQRPRTHWAVQSEGSSSRMWKQPMLVNLPDQRDRLFDVWLPLCDHFIPWAQPCCFSSFNVAFSALMHNSNEMKQLKCLRKRRKQDQRRNHCTRL